MMCYNKEIYFPMLLCNVPCAGHRKHRLGHLDWVLQGVGMMSQLGIGKNIWIYLFPYCLISGFIICIVLLSSCPSPEFRLTSPSRGMPPPGQLYAAAMWLLEGCSGYRFDCVISLTMEPCLPQGEEESQMKTDF